MKRETERASDNERERDEERASERVKERVGVCVCVRERARGTDMGVQRFSEHCVAG